MDCHLRLNVTTWRFLQEVERVAFLASWMTMEACWKRSRMKDFLLLGSWLSVSALLSDFSESLLILSCFSFCLSLRHAQQIIITRMVARKQNTIVRIRSRVLLEIVWSGMQLLFFASHHLYCPQQPDAHCELTEQDWNESSRPSVLMQSIQSPQMPSSSPQHWPTNGHSEFRVHSLVIAQYYTAFDFNCK